MKLKKISALLLSVGLAFSASVMAAPSGNVQSGSVTIEEAYNDDVKSQIEAKKSEIKMDSLRLSLRKISDADLKAILADYPNVKTLNISSKELTSVESIKDLKNLSELTIDAEKIADFSPLASQTQLTSLIVRSKALNSIKWMSEMKNLKFLQIKASPILTSYEGIPVAEQLKSVVLEGASPIDLKPILALKNIKKVELRYNSLKDLSPLCELANLEDLDLYGAEIADFSTLEKCPKLKTIMYYATKGSDYSTLGKIKTLVDVKGGLTKLSNIDWIPELPNIKKFDVFAEFVTDYSPILKNNTIEDFRIWNMKVPVDMSSLKGANFKKFTFWVGSGEVSNTDVISSFKNLENLEITTMKQTKGSLDGKFADGLTKLKSLRLSEVVALTTTEHMGSLESLEKLALETINPGQEVDLSFIGKLKNLKEVRLKDTKIKNFDAIAGAESLVTVNLEKVEGISSLAALKKLPKLKTVNVPKGVFSAEELTGFENGAKVTER